MLEFMNDPSMAKTCISGISGNAISSYIFLELF